jgi:hypothetical protein
MVYGWYSDGFQGALKPHSGSIRVDLPHSGAAESGSERDIKNARTLILSLLILSLLILSLKSGDRRAALTMLDD